MRIVSSNVQPTKHIKDKSTNPSQLTSKSIASSIRLAGQIRLFGAPSKPDQATLDQFPVVPTSYGAQWHMLDLQCETSMAHTEGEMSGGVFSKKNNAPFVSKCDETTH